MMPTMIAASASVMLTIGPGTSPCRKLTMIVATKDVRIIRISPMSFRNL